MTASTEGFVPNEAEPEAGMRITPVGARPTTPLSEHRTVSTAGPSVPADADARKLSAAGVLLMTSVAAAWTLAIGALAVWRHNQFLSHRFDLGNVVQAVWSSAHGRLLENTDGSTAEQASRLAGHVDPAVLLFVPFWWVHPAPETLIIVQAAALAAGIYPVAQLAMKYTGSRFATALLCGWYLLFPWLVWNAVNDVHAVTLAIPLLLFAIWFLVEHHLGQFALVAVLAMLTGELVGLTVAGLGVWYAIRYRRARAGLSIALAGAAWTAICLAVVIPAFNDGPSRFYGRFESVGGSPGGLLETLFSNPSAFVEAVVTRSDGWYIAVLLLPTALLALGAPLLLVVALPQLGINLLSDWPYTTQPMFQYVVPIVAPLVAATIVAIGRLPRRLQLVAAAAPLAAAMLTLTLKPPLPGEQGYVFARRESSARADAMREAIQLLPNDAPVSATNRLGAHLSDRRRIYLFPERSSADWVVVDARDPFVLVGGERIDDEFFRRLLTRFERDSTWLLVFERVDVRVYRRAS